MTKRSGGKVSCVTLLCLSSLRKDVEDPVCIRYIRVYVWLTDGQTGKLHIYCVLSLTHQFLPIYFTSLSSFLCEYTMPRDEPHPQAIFSLVPLNRRASEAVDHPDNKRYLSYLNLDGKRIECIDIGFNIDSKSPFVLANLGRHEAHIKVPGVDIDEIQC